MSGIPLLDSQSWHSSAEDTSRLEPHPEANSKLRKPSSSLLFTLPKVFVITLIVLATGSVVFALSHLFWPPLTSKDTVSPCTGFEEQCDVIAPFVFDSVNALTKQWPSTFAPNGHSIVPAILPRGVPLYHAKNFVGDVKTPTWLSFDPEMGLGIYASLGHTYEHTFVSTKSLNVLYIDGQGATLTDMGTLDSQTAFLRGKIELRPSSEFTYNETQRGIELCQRARQIRVDGFVRMDAGFEALICDIHASGLRQLVVANVSVPGRGASHEDDPELPRDPSRLPPYGMGNIFGPQNGFEWVRSGTWHYGGYGAAAPSPRETRVLLDLCGFVSFYDPRLTSLKDSHHGGLRPGEEFEMGWGLRRGHRLLEISIDDAQKVVGWVKDAAAALRGHGLISEETKKTRTKCSGTNWQTVTEVITTQHKSRAKELAGVLAQAGTWSDQKIVDRVQVLTHAVLHAFLEYPAPDGLDLNEVRAKAIRGCSTLYTSHLPAHSYNEFEALIHDSIEIVLTKLCEWEWDLFQWSEGRSTGLLGERRSANGSQSLSSEIRLYQKKTSDMMAWVGWDLWDSCDRTCAWNELCYIPMWPVVYSPGKHQGGPWGGSHYTKQEEEEFWRPKCISFEDYDKWGGRARDPDHQLPDPPWINEPHDTR